MTFASALSAWTIRPAATYISFMFTYKRILGRERLIIDLCFIFFFFFFSSYFYIVIDLFCD